MTPEDSAEIRDALANLPNLAHHMPGQPVDEGDVFSVRDHRNALNPERSLVVGNRGMGKSFWAHALLSGSVRARVANELQLPALLTTQVTFGFLGSSALHPVAPTPAMLEGHEPLAVWRTVMARAVTEQIGETLPDGFAAQVAWVQSHPEAYAALLTRGDRILAERGMHLLVLFDALERLGDDWAGMRERLQALLRFVLESQSFRRLRLKLFLRFDQFSDPRLFEFPDAAKLRNTAVDLAWPVDDLYGLLFFRMRGCEAFSRLKAGLATGERSPTRTLVEAMAGEFMGRTEKRGRVYTWLPTHLADAHGHISPRTFLTVWQGAASRGEAPGSTPIDYLGIHEGVRKASKVRLAELAEDYPWVSTALSPLHEREVPMPRTMLEELWRTENTFIKVQQAASADDRHILVPFQLSLLFKGTRPSHEDELLRALEVIGVVQVRTTVGTVDVPDIFRVEAKIKRRGGVQPSRLGREPGT